MIRTLRNNAIINKLGRIPLKKLISLTDYDIPRQLAASWRIAGEANIKLELIEFNLFSKCDDSIVNELYYYPNQYSEINELQLFISLSARSEFILDVGANTGIYSVAAAAMNPKCEIWAFEPYLSNFERLKINIELNEINNVIPQFMAIGDENKTINISVPKNRQICDSVSADSGFSNLFYRETIEYEEIEVKQIKLDDIIPSNKQVDLIKIDVESYEMPVLIGAKKILENMSPVIQCEVFVDKTRVDFFEQFLKPLGYYCYKMLKNGLAFSEQLEINQEGRDFLFTKRRLSTDFIAYADESLSAQLIP